MIEVRRGLTFVAYSYEGGPLRFKVPFPYLKREHVEVYVGNDLPRYVSHKWEDGTTLTIASQAESLALPMLVQVRRRTPIAEAAITFQNGASLPAAQLNTAVRQLLYRQQEVIEQGLDGNGLPQGGLPGGNAGDTNPTYRDIETIVGAVTQSEAFLAATSRIDTSDVLAETLLQEVWRSSQFYDEQRLTEFKVSEAVHRLGLVEESGRMMAEEYTSLIATLRADLGASYLEINTALVEEARARATALTQLRTDFEGATASILQTTQALSTADAAQTDALQAHISQVGNQLADVRTQISTKATPAEATAIAQTTVKAFSDTTFAALQQTFDAFVSSETGKWDATWSIKVNGGDPARPVVAGIALGANQNGSDFVVNADRFAITSADAYGNRKFPFVVGTVGGVSTVGITGSLLVDGSVSANKLTVNSLSALTANAGTINGGTFKTHTLDAQGNIVNALEFRAEMTNVGNWPLWIGTGVKNENNAIFWVDRTGRAGFAGEISAPNIRGNFQSIVPVMWRGSINMGTVSAEVCRFTLPAPVLQGESHIPVLLLSAGVDHTMTDNGRANILIERLEGATFVAVDDYFIIQGDGRKMNHALHFVDNATTAEQTYRVLVKNSHNGDKMNITKVSGLVLGIR